MDGWMDGWMLLASYIWLRESGIKGVLLAGPLLLGWLPATSYQAKVHGMAFSV